MSSVFSGIIGGLLVFFFSIMVLGSGSYNLIKNSVNCPHLQQVGITSDYIGSGERSALYVNGQFAGCVPSGVNLNLETPLVQNRDGTPSSWQLGLGNDRSLNDPFAEGGSTNIKQTAQESSQAILQQCRSMGVNVNVARAEQSALIDSCREMIARSEDCSSLSIPGVNCTSPGNVAREEPLPGTEDRGSDNPANTEDPNDPNNRNVAGTCSGEQELLKQEFEANCKTQHKQAHFCCGGGGAGCLVGLEPGSSGAAMASVGTMLASTLIGMRQMQGMAQNCDSQAGLANFGAALNGAMAAKCHSERKSCENTCQELHARVMDARTRCESDIQARTSLDTLAREIVAQRRSCESLAGNEIAMGSQAAMTLMTTSQMAKVCKDVIAASPPPVAPGIPGNDLCNNPSDLSNPYCRQQFCSQPGTANLPECQTQIGDVNSKLGGGGGHNNFSNASYGSRLGDADLSGLGETAQPQGPGVREIDIAANGPAPIQPGMQGGAMPGGAGGGGGDSGYDIGGGGSQKLNTGILNGFSSGGGYTVSGVPMANGGGYSNPTGNGGGGAGKKNEPFDLRQYLPKQPPQRNLAGLTPKGKEAIFASKHDNIFERISNKYKEFCMRKMLWCDGEEVPK